MINNHRWYYYNFTLLLDLIKRDAYKSKVMTISKVTMIRKVTMISCNNNMHIHNWVMTSYFLYLPASCAVIFMNA